jgi:uncharacterized protein YndB with AHSA1/START domain
MPTEAIKHSTLVFERTCAATVPRVFAALADPVERASWGTPSENAVLVYDQADFRVGGHDIFRGGSKQNPEYRGVTTYYDIVPNQRIISSETIEVGRAKLLISLSTTVLEPVNAGTKLSVTVQAVSLVGDDMIEGAETGYNASLDNLVEAMREFTDRDPRSLPRPAAAFSATARPGALPVRLSVPPAAPD